MTKTAIIWSRSNCTYCDQARALLLSRGILFEERKIDGVAWRREQLLAEVPTARTVPQIFIDGALVGGFTELQQLLG